MLLWEVCHLTAERLVLGAVPSVLLVRRSALWWSAAWWPTVFLCLHFFSEKLGVWAPS